MVMRSRLLCFVFAWIILFGSAAKSTTIYVPDHFPTIQDAIDNASDNDIIIVRPGIYVENLDFLGKAIVLKSEKGPKGTIIDGGNPLHPDHGSVVRFENGEGMNSVLDGFTLTNGTGTADGWRYGGGILCRAGVHPTIRNNIIRQNVAHNGGGICLRGGSSPLIEQNEISDNIAEHEGGGILGRWGVASLIEGNRITGNSAGYGGGGIMLQYGGSTPPVIRGNAIADNKANYGGGGILCENDVQAQIENNVFSRNEAWYSGGGICCELYAPGNGLFVENNLFFGNWANSLGGGFYANQGGGSVLRNNTFVHNVANMGHSSSGGLYCGSWTDTIVENSVFHGNTPGDIDTSIHMDALVVSYSNIETGWAGTGNISEDPLFEPGPNGFFYLSQIAAGQGGDSPCVDAGSDLASHLGMDAYWTRTDEVADSGTVDMGFHYGPFSYPWLQADAADLSAGGGMVRFVLSAASMNAGRNYLLLGSASGKDPGFPLPGGQATLPLNWDLFTKWVLGLLNTPLFSNFMGALDGAGNSAAALNAPALPPTAVGVILSFSYCLNNPFDFASNALEVEVVP